MENISDLSPHCYGVWFWNFQTRVGAKPGGPGPTPALKHQNLFIAKSDCSNLIKFE